MSTLVFTRRACLEGRRDKSTSIELCASMVAKLECHLINTQGPVTDPPNRGALSLIPEKSTRSFKCCEPSVDNVYSETSRQAGLEFVCIFGHDAHEYFDLTVRRHKPVSLAGASPA